MVKVALINPHWYMAKGNIDDLWLPIPNGLACLAGALRQEGHLVAIIDSLAEGYKRRKWSERGGRKICRVGLPEEELIKRIQELDPEIVGIGNMFTSVFSGSIETANIVRQALPSVKIIMGGVHPSCAPEKVASLPAIDYVLCGEGEVAFSALIRHIENPDANNMPPGIFWAEDGNIKNSGAPEMIKDLDQLPAAAYDLLDMELYRSAAKTDLINRGAKAALSFPVITSRGCPYGCIFCAAHKINGRRWRGRSPVKVVDEIEMLYREYKVNSFTVEDSNFSFDEERAIAICEEIQKRRLKIFWNLPNGLMASRTTLLLVKALKRAGCQEITLAAEHGDQEFLERVVKKKTDLQDVLRAAAMILKEGMSVSCFFMMGFPGETEKELAKTIDFGRQLAWLGALPIFFICSPLPGTEMHNTFVDKGYLPDQVLEYEEYLCSFRNPIMDMPNKIDLVKWQRQAMRQAYSILLLRHPIAFFRIPAVRKFIFSLVSPQKSWAALKKIFNLSFAKTGTSGKKRGLG